MYEYVQVLYGAVHKVRHAIFGQFLPPPPVTLRHTSRDSPRKYVTHLGPPPIFKSPSTKNPDKSPLVQIPSQLFARVFVRGVLSEGLLSGRFCPRWFLFVPVLSEYICYNRKLNITLNFMFRMYDKTFYKCNVTWPLPPSPVTNCHTFSDPYPSSVTYFMDGPLYEKANMSAEVSR